jgi:hypothetical protein
MHATIGTMNGYSRRLHDRPAEKRPVRVLAAIGFFVLRVDRNGSGDCSQRGQFRSEWVCVERGGRGYSQQ